MQNFKGTKISLISNSNIRYEGFVEEINSESATIALVQVRSFGTEGRRGNPADEVAPSNVVFNYIRFRAGDVKDLSVVEQQTEAQIQHAVPDDPAILGTAHPGTSTAHHHNHPTPTQSQSQSQSQSHQSQNTTASRDKSKDVGGNQSASQSKPAPTLTQRDETKVPQPRNDRSEEYGSNTRSYGHTNNFRGRGHMHGRGRGRFNQPSTPVPVSDFDFEASNAKFSKDELLKEFEKLKVSDTPVPSSEESSSVSFDANKTKFYDKKSFFDDISCEAKERTENVPEVNRSVGRGRMAQERQLNMETFGQATVDHRYGNNRYRGRGRGRGGYRGRPRYNYHHY